MRADNAVGRAGTFESFRLGMSEKFYVQSLRFRASRSGVGGFWTAPCRADGVPRVAGHIHASGAHALTSRCMSRQSGGCIVPSVSVVNRGKSKLREGRIEAALSMNDTGPESASRREGRSQRQ